MDGQNNNDKRAPKPSHGLRLIRGGASQHYASPAENNNAQQDQNTNNETSDQATQDQVTLKVVKSSKPVRRNPLLMQLNALADALENDVNQILKL